MLHLTSHRGEVSEWGSLRPGLRQAQQDTRQCFMHSERHPLGARGRHPHFRPPSAASGLQQVAFLPCRDVRSIVTNPLRIERHDGPVAPP
jgi:hypothetical protein